MHTPIRFCLNFVANGVPYHIQLPPRSRMFWSMGLLSCVIACVCGLLELLFFLLRVLVLSFIVILVVILLLLPVPVLLYLLYKLVVFVIRADADLTLLFKTLKPHYFDNKVVWVTGASSGSEFNTALKDIMECILYYCMLNRIII